MENDSCPNCGTPLDVSVKAAEPGRTLDYVDGEPVWRDAVPGDFQRIFGG